jgi:hypothetical protein
MHMGNFLQHLQQPFQQAASVFWFVQQSCCGPFPKHMFCTAVQQLPVVSSL